MATSMTATLAEIINNGQRNLNPMSMEIVRETLYNDSFIWSSLFPSKSIDGIANIYRRESTRPKVKTLDVGGTICEGYATYQVITDTVGRSYVQISLDKKVQTSSNLNNPWTDQLQSAIWEFSDKMQNAIINGAGSTDGEIKGLKTLCTAFGSGQKLAASTTTAGGAITLLDLDRLANLVKYPNKFYLVHPNIAIDLKALGMAMGGNTWRDVMIPYAMTTTQGYAELGTRNVQGYNGIPIFETEWLGTETTYSGSGKYRVICGSFAPGRGLEFFYPGSVAGSPTVLGYQMDPKQTKENHDEDYIRARWLYGISCKSTKALAQLVNVKFTNA